MTKTAELYGGSLYDLAVEENCSSEMMEELAQIRDLFRENPEYIGLLSEPAIAKAERLSLIDQAFGTQAMPYIVNFLKILCEEGMMREFFGCCEAFRERYNKDHNIAEAVVGGQTGTDQRQEHPFNTEDGSRRDRRHEGGTGGPSVRRHHIRPPVRRTQKDDRGRIIRASFTWRSGCPGSLQKHKKGRM